MASTKAIKNRIHSVGDTQKITNAMYLISSTKMRKARREAEDTKPYFDLLRREIRRMFAVGTDLSSRYYDADVDENVCHGRQIILKKIGTQSFDCRLGDLRYMIDFDGGNGRRGIYWVVWTGGNLTDVHMINATIREAKN